MFEIAKARVNKVVLPGDVIATPVSLEQEEAMALRNEGKLDEENEGTIRLGPGLIPDQKNQIIACKPGILRQLPNNKFFVESNQKRYTPMLEDMVIGTIVDRAGESYYLDINYYCRAMLPKLAFDGASKRNKPNLQLGALVYCRVVLANKDLDPELSCCSVGKKKDWVTREGTFGELYDGYVTECSLALCRQLLEPDCLVLTLLGEKLGYEIAVGMNGKVWLKAATVEHTVLIANAITNSEYLTKEQIKSMVKKLLATITGDSKK